MPVGNVAAINLVLDWVFAAGLTGAFCFGELAPLPFY